MNIKKSIAPYAALTTVIAGFLMNPFVMQQSRASDDFNAYQALLNNPPVQIPYRAVDSDTRARISFGQALSNAAIERTTKNVRYDGRYLRIGYPWGDVPQSMGVCTDVVIRSYRRLGIDLQQEVNRDIRSDFYAYPSFARWGLKKPDSNIDHRRVYNLQAFFKRHHAELPRSFDPRSYKPGDLVTWMVGPAFPHIGVVVNIPTPSDPNRLMISHNIAEGPIIEDILFRFPITGHYRYTPQNQRVNPGLYFAKTPAPFQRHRRNQQDMISDQELFEVIRRLEVASLL